MKLRILPTLILLFSTLSIHADPSDDLLLAVKRGSLPLVQKAIESGADPNTQDENSDSIFFLALKKKNIKLINYLMSLDINFSYQNNEKNSALHLLSIWGETKLAEDLYSKGGISDFLNLPNTSGSAPLHLAIQNKNSKFISWLLTKSPDLNLKNSDGTPPVLLAYEKKQTSTIKELITAGAEPGATNLEGNNLLHIAVLNGDSKYVSSLVKDLPILIDSSNISGMTPLMISVSKSNQSILNILWPLSSDKNRVDRDGNSLLHIAAISKLEKFLKTMVESGLDLNAKNNAGSTPLMESIRANQTNNTRELLKLGANPNLASFTDSPLEFAYKNKNFKIFKLLLESGASADANTYGVPIIHTIIENNDLTNLKVLLTQKPIIDNPDSEGNTPLMKAVLLSKTALVDSLIKAGANPNVSNSEGIKLIEVIVQKGYYQFLAPLAKSGVDLNVPDKNGKPLLLLSHESLLKTYNSANLKMFTALVEAGANVNIDTGNSISQNSSEKKKLLQEYIERDNESISNLLISKGANFEIKVGANSYLNIAANMGKSKSVSLLLSKNMDVNIRGENGDTPIMGASRGRYHSLVNYLIKNGADVNLPNSNGDTPLSVSVSQLDKDNIKSLLNAGANTEIKNSFGNPLILEACKVDAFANQKIAFDIIELLLAKNANINASNKYGNTPLAYAINRKNNKLIQFLIEKGADPSGKDPNGNTPLHKTILAAGFDRLKNKDLSDILETLLESGADPNVKNGMGDTPLHLAVQSRDGKDMVATLQASELLLNHSANPMIENKSGKSSFDLSRDEFQDYLSSNSVSDRIHKYQVELPNTSEDDTIESIAISPMGNVYIILTNPSSRKLMKTDWSGKVIQSLDLDMGSLLSVDSSENIYVLGIAPGTLDGKTVDKCKKDENLTIYARKLSPGFEEIWSRSFGEKRACKNTELSSLTLLNSGEILVGTRFSKKNYFHFISPEDGSEVSKHKISESPSGLYYRDSVVYYSGKYAYSFDLEKKKESKQSISLSKNTVSFITDDGLSYYGISKDRANGGFYLTKYSGKKLTPEWRKSFSSDKEDIPTHLSFDTSGSLFISGTTNGNLHGNRNFFEGKNDIFLMKLNKEGKRFWTFQTGSNEEESITGSLIDYEGNIVLYGSTAGDLFRRKNQGGKDAFLIKVKSD